MHDLLRLFRHYVHLLLGVESGRDHRYTDEITQALVLTDTHDDVRRTAGLALNKVVDLPDLVDGDLFVSAHDQQQYVVGSTDLVVVQQGRVQGAVDRINGALFAFGLTRAHDRRAAIGQHSTRIAQVDVLRVVVGNDLRNSAARRGKHFIGL